MQYDRAVQQAEEERNVNGDDDQAFFFNYLRDSYQAFLSGDDDAYDALDQQIASTFEEKYEAMENEMKELENQNENLRKQIEDLKSAEVCGVMFDASVRFSIYTLASASPVIVACIKREKARLRERPGETKSSCTTKREE